MDAPRSASSPAADLSLVKLLVIGLVSLWIGEQIGAGMPPFTSWFRFEDVGVGPKWGPPLLASACTLVAVAIKGLHVGSCAQLGAFLSKAEAAMAKRVAGHVIKPVTTTLEMRHEPAPIAEAAVHTETSPPANPSVAPTAAGTERHA
jgi:hypothetical protein